jgi:putative transposase
MSVKNPEYGILTVMQAVAYLQIMTKGPLIPGNYYHIFHHAVGSQSLFLSDDNYQYFLRRYRYFISPVADTLAYCLMPNHVHFFIEVKLNITIPETSRLNTTQYVSKQFANLFSSYSQAFNKQQKRFGNLFNSSFRRKCIDSDQYFTNLIKYIHRNPLDHGFVKDVSDWKYSSFGEISLQGSSFIDGPKVTSWFGGREQFIREHQTARPTS